MYEAYADVVLPEAVQPTGTGWLPPLPDLRDYTSEHEAIAPISASLNLPAKVTLKAGATAGSSVDLRAWCSPIENQGALGSCTAHAAMGIVEYFERRAYGRHIDGSRLFVYKATRNLMGVTGDTGAWLRNTMGALVQCGVAPERYWPYTDAKPAFDQEPPAFVYAVADNFEALRYFRHDPPGAAPNLVLASLKLWLKSGVPAMFGFFGFPSFGQCDVKGGIPYPCPGERAVWGHAIDAVGFDDGKVLKNTACNTSTTGAFLIRNSWGTGWGDNGYGWLPYAYLEHGLALDFWSLVSMGWVNTEPFQ